MINVIPVPGFSAPAVCIPAFRFFINYLPLLKYLTIFPLMPLIRGDKSNRTMSMNIVIPQNKLTHPVARLLDRFKSGFGIVRTIFARSKKRFRVGVVVADSRPAERRHDPQQFKFGIKGKAFLRRTIIRMQHQRFEDTSFRQNGLVNKTARVAGAFPIKHLPARQFSG